MLDLLIHGAQLIDGTGAAPRHADVGVQDGRIVWIQDSGRHHRARAQAQAQAHAAHQLINADGLVLAPGFIDAHTHDDRLLLRPSTPPHPRHPKLLQGVTTVITGNCGISLAPLLCNTPPPAPLDLLGEDGFVFAEFADYLQALQAQPPALNAACLVGHTTLRVAHMADLQKPATTSEAAAMAASLQRALQAGAFGLSTGVYYPPARAATAEEIM
jgi:N-acyl-D-amino-acid deacylase